VENKHLDIGTLQMYTIRLDIILSIEVYSFKCNFRIFQPRLTFGSSVTNLLVKLLQEENGGKVSES